MSAGYEYNSDDDDNDDFDDELDCHMCGCDSSDDNGDDDFRNVLLQLC